MEGFHCFERKIKRIEIEIRNIPFPRFLDILVNEMEFLVIMERVHVFRYSLFLKDQNTQRRSRNKLKSAIKRERQGCALTEST